MHQLDPGMHRPVTRVGGARGRKPRPAQMADSTQIILEGGRDLDHPDSGQVMAMRPGHRHVVARGRLPACVLRVVSLVLVVVGHVSPGGTCLERDGLHRRWPGRR